MFPTVLGRSANVAVKKIKTSTRQVALQLAPTEVYTACIHISLELSFKNALFMQI